MAVVPLQNQCTAKTIRALPGGAAIPDPTPCPAGFAVVQHAGNTGTSPAADSVTVTLGSPTTAGNTLIVAVSYAQNTGAATDLDSVTLGGSGAGFSSQAHHNGAAFPFFTDTAWADYSIAGGQTSIVVTAATAGGFDLQADVFEISGGLTALDAAVTVFNEAGSVPDSSFTSTASGTSTQPGEFVLGIVAAYNNSGAAFTITGPAAPWTLESQLTINTQYSQLCGYQVTTSDGTFTYAGTTTAPDFFLTYVAGVVAFK